MNARLAWRVVVLGASMLVASACGEGARDGDGSSDGGASAGPLDAGARSDALRDGGASLVPFDGGPSDGAVLGDAAAACASPDVSLEGDIAGVPATTLRFLGASGSECWASSELTLRWGDDEGRPALTVYVTLRGVAVGAIDAPLRGEVPARVYVGVGGDDAPEVVEGTLRVERLDRISFDATGPLVAELHASGDGVDLHAAIDTHVCDDFSVCL